MRTLKMAVFAALTLLFATQAQAQSTWYRVTGVEPHWMATFVTEQGQSGEFHVILRANGLEQYARYRCNQAGRWSVYFYAPGQDVAQYMSCDAKVTQTTLHINHFILNYVGGFPQEIRNTIAQLGVPIGEPNPDGIDD